MTFGGFQSANSPSAHFLGVTWPARGQAEMTFGAVPSIELIGIASPHGSGVVERSPCYALPLNAEPLACHTDDYQLSAGYRLVLPAREKFRVFSLSQLRSLPDSMSNTGCPIS